MYCHKNCISAVDLVFLFKKLFVRYLYWIVSERKRVKGTGVNTNANNRKFKKFEGGVTINKYIDQLDININLDRETIIFLKE